jgi:polar amino acid transport system permease protein
MTFDPAVVLDHWREILDGFAVTLWTWIAGVVLAAALGFVLALLMRGGGLVVRGAVRAFIELFRGTPFLVQLFILYYGGPSFGLVLEPLGAGLLGLTLYGSAYFAVIFRAGFAAVPRGQVEAAAVVGLSRALILRRIVLPQMLVVVLPALVNLVIILTKETAVLSIVTIPELTFVVRGIGNATFAYFETTLALALIYWGLVEATATLGLWAERRVGRFIARPA